MRESPSPAPRTSPGVISPQSDSEIIVPESPEAQHKETMACGTLPTTPHPAQERADSRGDYYRAFIIIFELNSNLIGGEIALDMKG